MVDKVTIVNGAIALVGGDAVAFIPNTNQIDDSKVSSRSRWGVRLFDTALGGVLSSWPFNDARGRRLLQRDPVAPAFGYSARYQLPPEVLKVVAVQGCSWTREGRYILCNGGDSIRAVTIERVAPEQLNELVADAVSGRLAHRMSIALDESISKQQVREKWAKTVLIEAAQGDNWEASSEILMTSGWMLAAQTAYAPELTALGSGGDMPTQWPFLLDRG